MKVKNMIGNAGGGVVNQFIITDSEGGQYFQSYDSIIAVIRTDGVIELDKDYWDYSVTTGRYRNRFLGEKKKETQKKIDQGIYKLVNLN